MSEQPPFTRREFLNTGLALMAASASVPAFLAHSSQALAQSGGLQRNAPGVPSERVLVVVQLSGGNDGLNTVIPFGDRAYHNARPRLAIGEDDILNLNHRDGLGLHPNLQPIHDLIGEGRCSIVQGVGYPNPNRSHFASMDVWHTGDALGGRGHGWIGKAMDQSAKPGDGMPVISIGAEAPLATQGQRVKPVAFESSDLFRFAGRDLHPAVSETYDRLQEQPPPAADDNAAFIYRTALNAQVASARVRDAVAGRAATSFPRTGLGRQLEAVAKMIRAELPTRVYYVALGGFDTHANQTQAHDRLMTEFGAAMQAFDRELQATGHADRVVTLAFSEFGRRVAQNASNGTDHGAAGPMFLFGSNLKAPGLVGKHPSLTKLDQGDLIFHTDFRQVYAELLDGWMKLDAAAALGRRYPRVGVI